MIEGLKIDVPSDELVAHLTSRSEHHTKRGEFYSQQVKSLRSGGIETKNVTNDPIASLEQSEQTHRTRAAFFKFMSEHIVPDETYRLEESDLTRLEIFSRYF